MNASSEDDPPAKELREQNLDASSPPKGAQGARFGRLSADVPLEELARRLVRAEASVDVHLATDFGPAAIHFRAGVLWDASIAQLSGEFALFRLFGLADATFEVVPSTAARQRTIHDPLDELLQLRRQRGDRWAQLVRRLPPLSTVLVSDLSVVSALAATDLAEPLWGLLRLADGRRAIIEVIEDSRRDAVVALEQIVELYERGIVAAEAEPSAVGVGSRLPGSLGRGGLSGAGASSERPPLPERDESPETERLDGPPPKPRGASLGRYQILAPLGRGGIGSVYLGRTVEPDGFRPNVAIKVLRSHLSRSDEASRTLAKEAAIASRIHHPNVVRVLDSGADDGQPYLVMEYVQGASLALLLSEGADAGSNASVVSIVLDALAGLEAAHELLDDDGARLEVVHHDVSPHNILVGIDGVARLSDFGVAQVQQTMSPDSASRYGKPAFTAPERLSGAVGDKRSDLFSVGVVLFNALSGKPLFSGSDTGAVLDQVLTLPIPPVSRSGRCSARFDTICYKALKRDPQKRYQSAREMADDVRRAARAEGLSRAPSKVSQWVRSVMSREVDLYRLDFLDESRKAQQSQEDASVVGVGVPRPMPIEPVEPSRTQALPQTGANRKSRTALKVVAVVLGLLVLAAAFLVPKGERPASPTKASPRGDPPPR